MTTGKPATRVGVYIPSDLSYANQYALRQARSIRGATIVSRGTPDPRTDDEPAWSLHAGPTSRVGAFASRAGISLFRRAGISPLDPFTAQRIRHAYESLDVAYTMFLPNAADLRQSLSNQQVALAVHAAGSDVTTIPSMRSRFARWSLDAARDADLVLCGSRFLQERLHQFVQPRRSAVHYIGVPMPPEVQQRRVASAESTIFIAVSRLHPVKGIRLTIQAFVRAFGGSPNVELRIVGDGPERASAEREAAVSAAAGRIFFLGELDRAGVDREIREAHAFVQHNQILEDGAEEALGGSILEAAAMGLPVVVTRSGGVLEAVVDGKTGLVVESGDIDGMADAMRTLAVDEAQRIRLGAAGRAHVAEHHNAAIQDARLAALLESL